MGSWALGPLRLLGPFLRYAKKRCVAKVLLAIGEIFLHENNRNYDSYRFTYKFAFILFMPFLTNQKQESGFQQVGDIDIEFNRHL